MNAMSYTMYGWFGRLHSPCDYSREYSCLYLLYMYILNIDVHVYNRFLKFELLQESTIFQYSDLLIYLKQKRSQKYCGTHQHLIVVYRWFLSVS